MASGLRGGRLRHKITLQELPAGSPRQSSSGMRTDAWATFASVRAGIRALSGRELEAAQQRHAALEVEIEIRYLAGVVGGMRALHLGVYYPILAVRDPELRQRRLLLDCSAGVVNPAAVTA